MCTPDGRANSLHNDGLTHKKGIVAHNPHPALSLLFVTIQYLRIILYTYFAMNPYREIFEQLNTKDIRYLVVGGVAVNLHGYRRFTGDMDILLALDNKNLDIMTALMHDLGYIERLPVELHVLADAAKVQQFLTEKGMTAYTFLSNKRERIDLDILAAASLHFDDYDQRKTLIELEDGLRVPVVSLNDLLNMKKEANRDKDLRDVEMLLQLKGI